MTAAKPTPGPLYVLRAAAPSDGGYDYAVMATIDGSARCIGEAFEVVDHGVRVPAEANARLWAAAPMLLEACRATMSMVEGDGMPPDWDFIRAAIAAASGTGETT